MNVVSCSSWVSERGAALRPAGPPVALLGLEEAERMAKLSALLLAVLGCAQISGPLSELERAKVHCFHYASSRCAGHPACESHSRRTCMGQLSWARRPEGWVRVHTDADLDREIAVEAAARRGHE